MAERNEIYKSKLRNAYLSDKAERKKIYKRHEALTPQVEMCQRRDLCRVERKKGLYGGYKKDILKEKLSEREKLFLICKICKGIMREANMSWSGERSCSTCDERYGSWFWGPSPNVAVRKIVSSLKCCCPLNDRGCDWLGTLNDCEDHLDTCGYVRDKCRLDYQGCGMVVERRELKVHETNNCLLRKVRCVHCDTELKSYKLTKHLEMCPKMEVSCELKCGKKLCRENMAQHLEQECGLVVETCKLGCGVELTRDELKIHVTDTCVQRKIPCKLCGEDFKSCDMTNHLDVCPRMKVSCELCDIVMCREDMTQHLKVDCVEKEIECPCRTEHLELKLTETELKLNQTELKLNETELELIALKELVMKQNAIIEKQDEVAPAADAMEEVKSKPAADKKKTKNEPKPAPEPEKLPEKKEGDLHIGFLQKYGGATPGDPQAPQPEAKPPTPEPEPEPPADPPAAEPPAAEATLGAIFEKPDEVTPAADEEDVKYIPTAYRKAKKEPKPAPEPEELPEKKEGDLHIGFLQKYSSSSFSKGWKRQFVVLTNEGQILNSYNFARDYGKKAAASFSIVSCDGVTTYDEDTTPKKPAEFDGAPANGFVIRILGKPTFFSAESEEEAKAWIDILSENQKKHYKPLVKRQSVKEKPANTAETPKEGATSDPPEEGATPDPPKEDEAPADPPKAEARAETPKEAASNEAPKETAPEPAATGDGKTD